MRCLPSGVFEASCATCSWWSCEVVLSVSGDAVVSVGVAVKTPLWSCCRCKAAFDESEDLSMIAKEMSRHKISKKILTDLENMSELLYV